MKQLHYYTLTADIGNTNTTDSVNKTINRNTLEHTLTYILIKNYFDKQYIIYAQKF